MTGTDDILIMMVMYVRFENKNNQKYSMVHRQCGVGIPSTMIAMAG